MRKKKIFECDKCEKQYIEMVVVGCKTCIKKTAPNLTKEELDEIAEIIMRRNKI